MMGLPPFDYWEDAAGCGSEQREARRGLAEARGTRTFPRSNQLGALSEATLEETMPLKVPWYSTKAKVHHNNSNCNTGDNIEKENISSGTGGKPLCQKCKGLNALRKYSSPTA